MVGTLPPRSVAESGCDRLRVWVKPRGMFFVCFYFVFGFFFKNYSCVDPLLFSIFFKINSLSLSHPFCRPHSLRTGTTGLPPHLTSVLVPKEALVDDLKYHLRIDLAPLLDNVPKPTV